MNTIYRISLNRAWLFATEVHRSLLLQKNAFINKTKAVKACCYCKKYGLYDDEEEDAVGEFNHRGAYIDHRSTRLEKERNNDKLDYEDIDSDDFGSVSGKRIFERQGKFSKGVVFQRGTYSDYRGSSNRYKNPNDGYRGYNDSYKNPNNGYRDYNDNYRISNDGYRNHGGNRYAKNPFSFYRYPGEKNIISRPQSSDSVNKTPVQKNFYSEHPDVAARAKEEVDKYRMSLNMIIRGNNVPNPITKFSELHVPDSLLQLIQDQNFPSPTPIQSQGWPIALSGRDMIGISQTGSGKTLVFTLPAMVHIMNQPQPEAGYQQCLPQALVLAPTRELAQQIHAVSSKFRHFCGVRSSCAYGGASKGPQFTKMIGAQMCIATPGRLIDFLNEGSVNLNYCSYLVLDEADRMLDMGFEPQIRQIIDCIKPDRQTLMWSATWPKEVQSLAEDYLSDYIQVTIGSDDLSANPNIKQNVYVISREQKSERFLQLLRTLEKEGNFKVLVFAQTKRQVDLLAQRLNHQGILAMAIHGDVSQYRRDRVLDTFRSKKSSVLIATDVAARGIDVSDIAHVINYDFPTNIEDYIHRIGRTARGSKTGEAHSLFTYEDANLAKDLINVLQKVGQTPTPELVGLVNNKNRVKRTNFYGRNRYQEGAYY